jgi:hypothetical protein
VVNEVVAAIQLSRLRDLPNQTAGLLGDLRLIAHSNKLVAYISQKSNRFVACF